MARPPFPLRAARLVIWGNAFLAGHLSLDETAEQIASDGRRHRVHGQSGEDSLPPALGWLALAGVRGLRLVLPVPGDPGPLPGPSMLNDRALDAGEAAVCVGAPLALVPLDEPDDAGEPYVRWEMHERADQLPAAPDLGEAGRQLAAAVREATEALAVLDVAGMAATTESGLVAVRQGPAALGLPAAFPPRAAELVDRAWRLAAVMALAAQEDGSAVSASAMATRRAELAPVAAAARRAFESGCSVLLEPAGRDRP